MITFGVIQPVVKSDARLVYRRSEYAFDMEPKPGGCKTCVTVNEVELEYGDERRVLCVSGYCPYQSWVETHLLPPAYSTADLLVKSPIDVTPGVVTGLNDLKSRWPVHVNRRGWVCIGDPDNQGDQAVEFAPGSVAVLKGDRLLALWLHPVMVGEH